MADRKRSNDGEKDTDKVADTDAANRGVPGAHGKGDDFDNGATGVSRVRGGHDEIQPSEDVDNDKD